MSATGEIATALGLPGVPTSSVLDEFVDNARRDGKRSLYFFASAICGYDKLQLVPHFELCDFIQRTPKQRKVCLIPRDCYKSTIGSKALPLWILIQDDFCGLPGREHRILCASFSSENAKKHIKAIRHLCERNVLLQNLYPELIPDFTRTTWTDSNLLFPRLGVYGEDTIEAAGVDTHLVSRHYTIQIKDDLEDEKAMQSPTVREKVKSWYRAAEALFVNEREAYDLLIGTRWGIDDLYASIKENESDTYEFHTRPLHWTREDLERDAAEAVESNRKPVFEMEPDKFAPDANKVYYFFEALFPKASCERIRAKQGSFMYSMLYLNNPKDASLAEFNERDFRYYSFDSHGDLRIEHSDGTVETVAFDGLRRVLFWDPAMGTKDGTPKKENSRNAMVAMGKDRLGRYFVLDTHAERNNPTFLYTKYISLHRRYQIQKAAIEDVAFQRILKFPLYHEQRLQNHIFPVIDQPAIGDKDVRIRTLIPSVEEHLFYIRRQQRELIDEMKTFPLNVLKDLLDACAACIPLFGLHDVKGEREQRRENRAEMARTATRSTLTGY